MKRYRKAIVASAGVLLVVGKVFADGTLDAGEIGELAVAVAVAIGVERIPNAPARAPDIRLGA